MKLLKADPLGFSRVESSSMSRERQAEYEAEGYRQVGDLEFELALLVTKHSASQIVRIVNRLASEIAT